MSSTPNEIIEHHRPWHKATHTFAVLSEACNSGIVIDIINMFYHSIMIVAAGMFGFLAHYADAGIYVFKSLIRATKAIGRYFFDIKFEEDVEQYHLQTILDLISMLFFIATIVLFTAVSSPIASTIGWILALIGLSIVGYSDYYLPKTETKKNLDDALSYLLELTQKAINQDSTITNESLDEGFQSLEIQYKLYQIKNNSFRLYMMLVVGLSTLLICNSATNFATGLTLVGLGIMAKIASVYLGCLAMVRFHNYLQNKSLPKVENSLLRFHQLFADETKKDAKALIQEFSNTRNMELDFEHCQAIKP